MTLTGEPVGLNQEMVYHMRGQHLAEARTTSISQNFSPGNVKLVSINSVYRSTLRWKLGCMR